MEIHLNKYKEVIHLLTMALEEQKKANDTFPLFFWKWSKHYKKAWEHLNSAKQLLKKDSEVEYEVVKEN